MTSPDLLTVRPEPRHFAPYGSTNAACDETVPRTVPWDTSAGEYASDRFTVRREAVTCRECTYRLTFTYSNAPIVSSAQTDDLTERARLAAGHLDASDGSVIEAWSGGSFTTDDLRRLAGLADSAALVTRDDLQRDLDRVMDELTITLRTLRETAAGAEALRSALTALVEEAGNVAADDSALLTRVQDARRALEGK